MKLVTRRTLMKAAAAGLATPALRRGAVAAEPLKVGLVYLGPIGDWGWTWAHERGRKAMVEALKGQVVADYVENVKEDASATPILKDLAQAGHKLIFATTFGYMDQTVEAAKQFPDVKFEHCTGYKRLPNLGDYNTRFHQGRAVEGAIAGMTTKSNTIGYLGSYKVPEVVLGVNAFTLAAQAVESEGHDPAHHDQLVVRSGEGSGRRADARQSRLRCRRPAHRQPRRPSGGRSAQGLVLRQRGGHVALRAEDAIDRGREHLGPLLHLARQSDARGDVEVRRRLVGHEGRRPRHGALQQGDARQCEGRRRHNGRRLEGRQL